MSSRRVRAKRATAKQNDILAGIAQAARASEIASIVRKNKASNMERNYYGAIRDSVQLVAATAPRANGGGYAGKVVSNRKPLGRWKG